MLEGHDTWIYKHGKPGQIEFLVHEISTKAGYNQYRENILKKVYADTFIEQLFDWCTFEDMCPQKITLAIFKKWLDLVLHSVVADMVDGEIFTEGFYSPLTASVE